MEKWAAAQEDQSVVPVAHRRADGEQKDVTKSRNRRNSQQQYRPFSLFTQTIAMKEGEGLMQKTQRCSGLWKSLDVAEKEKFNAIFSGGGGVTLEEEEEAKVARMQMNVALWKQFLASRGKLEQYS